MDMHMPMVDAAAAAEESSSSASSSSSSLSPPTSPLQQQQQGAKRRAGRKKFRETRHPVYRGVRARAGGRRWVCEVREPQAQARIWLGTYPTPEMAARAHDVAAIALRGAGAHLLNFPDSAHTLPRPRTAAPDDIRCAAAQAAELYRPPAAASGSASPQQTPIITTTTTMAAPPPLVLPVPEQVAASSAIATETACCCPGRSTATGTATACFLDEDAIFDMPGLIDDMARGMLLTPPAMGRGGLHFHWGAALDDDDDDHVVDYCTLWMD